MRIGGLVTYRDAPPTSVPCMSASPALVLRRDLAPAPGMDPQLTFAAQTARAKRFQPSLHSRVPQPPNSQTPVNAITQQLWL